MCNIPTIVISWSRPLVPEPWIVINCSVVHGSWSLTLAAWSLTLAAWGLRLAAWSLIRLELEAWRLQLVAYASQLSSLYSTLDGGKYGSYFIYSFINFLCLALPYFRSGSALIFFKISFCLVFAIRYIFNWFCPASSTFTTLAALRRCRAARALRNYTWRVSPGRGRWAVNLASW